MKVFQPPYQPPFDLSNPPTNPPTNGYSNRFQPPYQPCASNPHTPRRLEAPNRGLEGRGRSAPPWKRKIGT